MLGGGKYAECIEIGEGTEDKHFPRLAMLASSPGPSVTGYSQDRRGGSANRDL